VSHQWKSFHFPLIAYIISGKLHINGVNQDKGKKEKPEKKCLHVLYTNERGNNYEEERLEESTNGVSLAPLTIPPKLRS
jgi:hypothetical protein